MRSTSLVEVEGVKGRSGPRQDCKNGPITLTASVTLRGCSPAASSTAALRLRLTLLETKACAEDTDASDLWEGQSFEWEISHELHRPTIESSPVTFHTRIASGRTDPRRQWGRSPRQTDQPVGTTQPIRHPSIHSITLSPTLLLPALHLAS